MSGPLNAQQWSLQLEDLYKQEAELQEQIAVAKNHLILTMRDEGLKEIITPNGQGFRMQASSSSTQYLHGAYNLIDDWGISDLFRSEPKITISKVEQLRKEGAITGEQYNALNSFKEMTQTGAPVISKFTPKITQKDLKQDLDRFKTF